MDENKNETVTEHTSALVVAPNVRGAVETMRSFQDLKTKLLTENDIVKIEGRPFIKRSGWRQISLAFNVSTEVIGTYPIKDDANRIIGYTVEARAMASNGRSAVDQASCEFMEIKGAKTHHNCITRATTRALRATSDLCGGGEVSAEEMDATTEEGVTKYGDHYQVIRTPSSTSATQGMITEPQQKKIGAMIRVLELTKPGFEEVVKNVLGTVVEVEKMTKQQASDVISTMVALEENHKQNPMPSKQVNQ